MATTSAKTKTIDVDEVPKWWVERGVGHVVRWFGDGMIHSLCDILVFGSEMESDTPPRICRECRRRLKTAKWMD